MRERRIGAAGHERRHDLGLEEPGRQQIRRRSDQRRRQIPIRGVAPQRRALGDPNVRIGAAREERLHQIQIASQDRRVQRRVAAAERIGIGAVFEQQRADRCRCRCGPRAPGRSRHPAARRSRRRPPSAAAAPTRRRRPSRRTAAAWRRRAAPCSSAPRVPRAASARRRRSAGRSSERARMSAPASMSSWTTSG